MDTNLHEWDFMGKLLDGVEVEWKALGDEDFFEIANTARRPIKASLRAAGKTPYYGANNVQDYVDGQKNYWRQKKSVFCLLRCVSMIFGLALKEVFGGRAALWGLGAWTLSEICEALVSKPSRILCRSV